mmetsp:Transcript_3265/g.4787  ORF Transcript_3265/g.4787 Transcript_3265/m.4787 type:complete len:106 (-) Transcript_3265:258-575(-)
MVAYFHLLAFPALAAASNDERDIIVFYKSTLIKIICAFSKLKVGFSYLSLEKIFVMECNDDSVDLPRLENPTTSHKCVYVVVFSSHYQCLVLGFLHQQQLEEFSF